MKHFLVISLLIVSSLLASPSFAAFEKEKKEIKIYIRQEPPDLNAMKATDAVSFQVLGHVMEGLTTFDKRGRLTAGVAEKWDITPTEATFHLRKNAKWSDGKPVTAKDFVFAWRNVVNPKTASQYAFIMYTVKNGEAISKGKMPLNKLGVTAVNDHTLKVELERPTGYFLGMTSFATFYPAREDIVKKFGDKYASEYNHAVYNGPFKLTKWVHGASLRMDKNEHYWNSAKIYLNAIDIPYIVEDQNTIFNLFKDKKIAYADGLGPDSIKNSLKEKYRLKNFAEGVVFYHEFNHRKGKPTANLNLRKAIAHAFDNRELVNKVIGRPGYKPSDSLFPEFLKGEKDSFIKEHPPVAFKVDTKLAKSYLEKARKELGGKIPALVLLCDDAENSAKQAQYFQQQMKERLGLEIKIDKQIFKQRLAKMTAGEFDLVAAGWGPDYDDIMTFGDLMASWNENNRGKFKSADYDAMVRKAQNSADPKVRMEAFAQMQKILHDEVAIVPHYERGLVYIQNNQLRGLQRIVVGPDPFLVHAKIK
ncbi:MAG: peptide ABC transporter substrate-binding protein [Bdellovibrionota bacterium]|nr:peptide ABC transporter substrate-binding protein [Pseudobdellovibrionaceae bacterium]|tara:strand:- start:5869 stop:7467 length:1599 start_codon:yes stop_codon:yes gene_type:complete